MYQTTLKIDGMMCGMCESHINDTIRKAAPVKKVTSSHAKGEAVVLTDEPLDIEAVKAAVHATGYEVTDASSEPYDKKKVSLFKKCCPFPPIAENRSVPMPAERFFIKQARRETGGPVCSIQKPVHPAGGQSRPPLRITEALKFRRRGRRLCRPEKCNEFAENSRKNGASQAAFFTPVGRLRFYTRSLPLPPA